MSTPSVIDHTSGKDSSRAPSRRTPQTYTSKSTLTILIHTPILTETWNLILNYNIYEADALQITTFIHSQSNALISSDKKLIKASRKTGLKTFHITKDEEKLKKFIK